MAAILQKLVFTKASSPNYSIVEFDDDLQAADSYSEVSQFTAAYRGTEYEYSISADNGTITVERLWFDETIYNNYKEFLGDALDAHRASLESMGVSITLTETLQ